MQISLFSSVLWMLTIGLLTAAPIAKSDLTPVKKWIASQAGMKSLSADFVQTRTFRTLRDPLERQGHIWFQSPDAFRWELGSPPTQIVLRYEDEMALIEPKKKRAQRLDPATTAKQSGRPNLAMMEFPLATDFAEFEREFEILDIRIEGTHCTLNLLPRDPEARKMVRDIQLDFDSTSHHLLAFEITFRDGSSLRNAFSNTQINTPIDPNVFGYDLTGYTVRDADP
jgi:outer membrane lipoprotein carrier protein